APDATGMIAMRMRRSALSWAWAVFTLGSHGCATTAPQAGETAHPPTPAYAYSVGRGIQDFSGSPGAVHAAVLDAMDDLKMTVVKRGRDGSAVQVDGRTPDHRTVTVTLRPQQAFTRVSCRIGWFGD